ncbi:MAG: SLC26A/SulP transporter family protein [Spirochaetaceae bacterium]
MAHGSAGGSPAGRALAGVAAGLLLGIITALFQLSYASLIFSDSLAPFVSRGASLLLLGTALTLTVGAILSTLPSAALVPQDTPIAIMAAVATAIAAGFSAPLPATDAFHTVIAAIMATSAVAAVVFLLTARLGLARFVRVMPYPVVGGFLAGVGWIMMRGALTSMTGFWPRPEQLVLLFSSDVILRWLPALLFALGVLLISRRTGRHPLLLPVAVAVGTATFYAALFASGGTVAEATAEGWLMGRFSSQRLWLPLSAHVLQTARWSLILAEWGTLLTAVAVSALAAMLNIGAVELLTGADARPDRELTANAAANAVGLLVGSPISYHSVGYTAFATRMDATSRVTTLTTAAVCAAAVFFGGDLLVLFPKPVLGALLVFVGLGFLADWLYDGWFRLRRSDYLVGIGMLVAVAFVGILEAMAIGVLASMVIFVINYGRTEVVYQEMSGRAAQSNVEWPFAVRELLRKNGDRIHVARLRGFLFFATAYTISTHVRRRLDDASRPAPWFFILDFRHVRGIDGAAEIVMDKVIRTAADRGIRIMMCGLGPVGTRQMQNSSVRAAHTGTVSFYPDLDHALEACEEELITSAGKEVPAAGAPEISAGIDEILTKLFPDGDTASVVRSYATRHDAPRGTVLMREGDPAEHLYIAESGEYGVFLERGGQPAMRLRTVLPGAIFGELEVFAGRPRAATVVATKAGRCYGLSTAALRDLEAERPDVAAAFQRAVLRFISERSFDLNRTIRELGE